MTERPFEKAVRERLIEWETARKEHDALRAQYFATGPVRPGEPFLQIPNVLTIEALASLKQAHDKEEAARQRWDAALEDFRRSLA